MKYILKDKRIVKIIKKIKSNILWYLKYASINELDINIKQFKFKFDTSSLISKEWFFPRYISGIPHEKPVCIKLINVLEENSIFFDIGANLGFYSILAAEICKKGYVHSFEIDPFLICNFKKNISKNNLKNIRINIAAVFNQNNALVSFHPTQKNNKSTNTLTNTGIINLPTITIDNYCNRLGIFPNVVKIDVEGAEYQVLKGMRNILKKRNIKIFLEIHPNLLKKFNSKLKDIFKLMDELNYNAFIIKNHRNKDRNSKQILIKKNIKEINCNSMILYIKDIPENKKLI